jgi:hypothetical protein
MPKKKGLPLPRLQEHGAVGERQYGMQPKMRKAGRPMRPAFVFDPACELQGLYYLVTWPRISPPGLAAVWTLT